MSIGKMIHNRAAYSCEEDQGVEQAIKTMKEKNVGSVLVKDSADKLVGMITDRDIALRFWGVDEARRKDMKAKDLMTSPVHTISDTAGVHELIQAFHKAKNRRIVVENESGQISGVLSTDDVLPLLAEELSELSKAFSPTTAKLAG